MSVPPTTPAGTVRLTVAQALVRFLAAQFTERDGVRERTIPGAFGIFGHGNVAGVGQALLQNATDPGEGENPLPYYQARNEQNMVHSAVAYARTKNRLQALACAASIGPGSTNMITGAALATVDRIPVLLLPSDIFATRTVDPVLQQLEDETGGDVSVNDAFRPVSRYFDRISRPEQLIPAALQAMRVLTDPAETGAVTLSLPQDVQAEAFDWPLEFFRERTWHVGRPVPEPAALERAVAVIRSARRPVLIAGGGAIYSEASAELAAFADATGIPVLDTQAGKGALSADHPLCIGGVGSTGNNAANDLAAEADVIIGVGTRYTDFTTASHTAFRNPDARFVNLNIKAFDAAKHSATMVVADARTGLDALREALGEYRAPAGHSALAQKKRAEWKELVEPCFQPHDQELPAQTEIFGALNELMGDEDIVINAAGSMPGDLQALWKARSPIQYHLEYGYSCMGYELPASLGVKMAAPDSEVVAIIGDGTFQMAPQEIATIVAERMKVILVILQNHGWSSIGSLSESHGSQRFGTKYRMRDEQTGMLDGDKLPFDIPANIRSYGLEVQEVSSAADFREAYRRAEASTEATAIVVNTDLYGPNPPGNGWWDVPVSQVSRLESTQQAFAQYEAEQAPQRHYL
ncbi:MULTISPECIES: 3D-(3,5/4)-trihydroxycyclohexane-1,2-dione acylhydrolase (decyclizing) [Brachybacterium]|uniref:3D-(3,5/4)-trihydroxycyclohexane-1,2-dione acylhydrolase (decyclizing) n=1 Tax=Brachybacterium TaxID=43668 RepID=UPI000BB8D91B|nr:MULTISPECIES: 3D-(3,5/4)-trihydroxycyclohexane-1,2-dione acylhydrolase (decyclizing) [Brachybacterium]PCC32454.1 3D-(3,5/4)-trihydroxycyclohexane-1,2-dione acylhydrolase (decyclizing) [Brachybacterium alimentarium]RCS62569.1 3D-(3,5/4)-trihydroxycyclohexane-1,2-dione acylhydrolase (decyclizing) [Brachybacterium sp. JB7]RCS74368.1 3D-(3,5/4)-trihydroxycyclohexane-1,2-dione acylhydrolase (decyclizing) [Brachybacterium alimentarium]RCS80273.1 3D-(3,5/4)-trihydroxycyclohexane-1,2-dione acylhydro